MYNSLAYCLHLLYRSTFIPSVIIRMRIAKAKCKGMDLYLKNAEQTGVPGETPRQPVRKSVSHIFIRGENSPLRPGIEPSPSNIGDKLNLSWSERAGSNPLKHRFELVLICKSLAHYVHLLYISTCILL